MLELIEFLKLSIIEHEDLDIEYKVISDYDIEIIFGWSEYEESSETILNVSFSDLVSDIYVVGSDSGYSVMVGDCENTIFENFKNVESLINYITNLF